MRRPAQTRAPQPLMPAELSSLVCLPCGSSWPRVGRRRAQSSLPSGPLTRLALRLHAAPDQQQEIFGGWQSGGAATCRCQPIDRVLGFLPVPCQPADHAHTSHTRHEGGGDVEQAACPVLYLQAAYHHTRHRVDIQRLAAGQSACVEAGAAPLPAATMPLPCCQYNTWRVGPLCRSLSPLLPITAATTVAPAEVSTPPPCHIRVVGDGSHGSLCARVCGVRNGTLHQGPHHRGALRRLPSGPGTGQRVPRLRRSPGGPPPDHRAPHCCCRRRPGCV